MNSIWIIVKKELMDILRDRKTLITSIFIPLIIMPAVMYLSLSSSMNLNKVDDQVVVAVNHENALTKALENNSVTTFTIINATSAEEAFSLEEAPKIFIDFPSEISITTTNKIVFHYDFANTKANETYQTIINLFNDQNKVLIQDYLKTQNIDPSILDSLSFAAISTTKATPETAFSMYFLNLLLPMIILGFSSTGIIPLAADFGAGEKERGTLEPLLTTKVSRNSIVIGKMIVISIFGLVSTVISVFATLLAVKQALPSELSFSIAFSLQDYLVIFLIATLFVLFTSILSLTLSIIARSNKEANTYLMPITIVPMVISFIASTINIETAAISLYHIPILNTSLIIKEVISQQLNLMHLAVTVAWLIGYIIIAVFITRTAFNRESVIFRS